jgi:hypothetical protein
MQTEEISLEAINIYGGTQARAQTNDDAIESYAEAMAGGVIFPPIALYFDGTAYWLADGFHRYLAAKRNQSATIKAEVQPGGRTDALKHALGANVTNGVHRNSADKRNAVEIALEEWPDRANPVIAEICHVSVEFVRTTRVQLTKSGHLTPAETVIGRDGKEYPAQVERQARGKTEGKSSDDGGSGGGGGGRGRPSTKGEGGSLGGGNMEIEREARAMIRRGEINPFELPTIFSANADDYAATVINLLGTMKREDPKRNEGLLRIKRWVEKALAGEVETLPAEMPINAVT